MRKVHRRSLYTFVAVRHVLWMRCKAVALFVLFSVLCIVLLRAGRAHAAPVQQAGDASAPVSVIHGFIFHVFSYIYYLNGYLSQGWQLIEESAVPLPSYWYLLMAALALLVPAGFVLVCVAGLEAARAWNAALGALAAIGVTGFGYWAVGFGLQFGGVGLVYTLPELRMMVWEWSPFATDWGVGWGVVGLSGWFLSGPNITPLVYALFLAHLPWAMTAAALPVMALRGRAPATATLVLAFLIGSVFYPLAGNWVRGGGWLGALGRNLNLGHGLVDFGGAGTVFLVAGCFALSALLIWVPRRPRQSGVDVELPPVQLPLLATVGSLLILAGVMGWSWANPLQTSTISEIGMMRGAVNSVLYAGGGALLPLIYTWFVTGRSDPLMAARGLAAGVVAGLAVGPFVQPGVAFGIGFLVGATVPFVAYITEHVMRLDDATGVVHVCVVPAIIGLLLTGLLADGVVGRGWQTTGVESYLGVTGQGVSGLFVARGFQPDFPGQFQAQVIGILALGLWGFVVGLLICAPVALAYYGIQRAAHTAKQPAPGHTTLHDLDVESYEQQRQVGHRMGAFVRRRSDKVPNEE